MILEQMRRRTNEIFKEQMRRKWMCRGGNGCAEEEMDVQRGLGGWGWDGHIAR